MAESDVIHGNYFFPGSSRGTDAHLVPEGETLRVFDSEGVELVRCLRKECRVTAPVGRQSYRFAFADGGAFETTQYWLVTPLFGRDGGGGGRWQWRLEDSWRAALLALVLIPLIAFGVLRYGLPLMAEIIAYRIPETTLDALDRQVLATLDGRKWTKPTEADDESGARLDLAWQKLGGSERYHLTQRDSPLMGANAFALPGGTIVVTDQLLDILSERQLTAVLAHEIGHVEKHHGIRHLIEALGTSALFAALVGDVSWVAETVLVSAPAALQQLSYSRDAEREADRFAVDQLALLGISPGCLGSSLAAIRARQLMEHKKNSEPPAQCSKEPRSEEKSDRDSGRFDYLSTHPGLEERISRAGGMDCPTL